MKEGAELVLIPCAGRGHIAAALEFAKLVVGRDDRLSITVLIANPPNDPSLAVYTDSIVARFAPWQRIKFALVKAEPSSAIEDTTNFLLSTSRFVESLKLPVKNHVHKIALGSGKRLVGFVVDVVFASMADVAEEFGIPTYVFWTSGHGSLSLMLHLLQLREQSENAIKECADFGSVEVPGFGNSVPAHAIPLMFFDSTSASVLFNNIAWIRRAKGVLLNSCIEIEPHAIRSLNHAVYPVGPVLNLTDTDCGSDGADIVEWLDGQPPLSVIFLCFGSLGSFGPDQLREIALALERTRFRFLWTLRVSAQKDQPTWISDACEDPSAILPEGFLERAANVGRVIQWAPQTPVLAHPAVGGFVSHCGWNSLLESLWFGVPVAAWPLYAEQQLNAFEMVTELGLAVAVKPGRRTDNSNEAPLVSAEEIEAAMRRVMEGESAVRKRVKETSEKCRKAVTEGGSSLSALDSFINNVFEYLDFPK